MMTRRTWRTTPRWREWNRRRAGSATFGPAFGNPAFDGRFGSSGVFPGAALPGAVLPGAALQGVGSAGMNAPGNSSPLASLLYGIGTGLQGGGEVRLLPDPRQLLMGSSFLYSHPSDGAAPGPLGQWSAWGGTAATQFSGADGPVSLNGAVATATLGLDSRWDRWFGGVVLAYSEGEGAYNACGGQWRGGGEHADESAPVLAL